MLDPKVVSEVAQELVSLNLLPKERIPMAEMMVRVVHEATHTYKDSRFSPRGTNRWRHPGVPLKEHKKWLTLVAQFYNVPELDIVNTQGQRRQPNTIVRARQTFLWICLYEGINIQHLSMALGKNRTTLPGIMKHGRHNRNITEEFQIRLKHSKSLNSDKQSV